MADLLDDQRRLGVDTGLGRKPRVNMVLRRKDADLEKDGVLQFDRLIEGPLKGPYAGAKPRGDDESSEADEQSCAQRRHSPLSIYHPAYPTNIANCRGRELSAKRMNQALDGVAFDLFIPAVYRPFKLLARREATGPVHQRVEQRIFASRQATG